MIVTRIRALRGPNLWSRHTAIEAVVNCRPEENSIAQLPDFEARLRARFPALGAWPANSLDISLAQALALTALRLQAVAGCPVTFSRCATTLEPGTYQIVVEYSEEAVGRMSLE